MADDRDGPEVRREWRRRGLQTAAFVGTALVLILVVLLSTLAQRSRRVAEEQQATVTAQAGATETALVARVDTTRSALRQQRATAEARAAAMAASWAASFPVRIGTPVPRPVEAISAANAPVLVELARWGKGWISEVAWSPDGRLLAVATSTGVYLYDVPGLGEPRVTEYAGGTYHIAFSPDGQLLAVATSTGVYLYDTAALSEPRAIELAGGTHQVTFSPDGALLAVGMLNGTARVWDVETLAERQKLSGVPGDVSSAAFSPDGALLAIAAGEEGAIRLVDLATEELAVTLQGPSTYVRDLAFSPDGTLLLSGSPYQLWEVATGEERPLPPGLDEATSNVVFFPDGTRLAAGMADGTVQLWDLATGEEAGLLEQGTGRIYNLSFSPDGVLLATVEGQTDTIHVREVETGREIAVLEEYTAIVSAVAFSPDGSLLAASPWDGRIQLWDVATGSVQRTLEVAFPVGYIAFSPDGALLVASTGGRPFLQRELVNQPGAIKVWDLRAGQEMPFPGEYWGSLYGAALSPDGMLLATTTCREKEAQADGSILCRDSQVVWWDLSALRWAQPTVVTGTLDVRGIPLGSLAFSPGGIFLAVGTEEGAIHLWDVGTWQSVLVIEGLTQPVDSLAFSPTGAYLASARLGDSYVRLWDVRTGEQVQLFNIEQSIYSGDLAFSPDGSLLAIGTWDGARLLEIGGAGNVTHTPGTFGHVVFGVTFSPDGTLLATVGWDGTVRLWGIPPE